MGIDRNLRRSQQRDEEDISTDRQEDDVSLSGSDRGIRGEA